MKTFGRIVHRTVAAAAIAALASSTALADGSWGSKYASKQWNGECDNLNLQISDWVNNCQNSYGETICDYILQFQNNSANTINITISETQPPATWVVYGSTSQSATINPWKNAKFKLFRGSIKHPPSTPITVTIGCAKPSGINYGACVGGRCP